jgi:hypothetical protein
MNFFKDKKFWIIGVSTSIIGIMIVKLIIPNFLEYKSILSIIGYTLSLGGLVVITFGTRKR